MNELCIVVEGKEDEALLRKLLPTKDRAGLRFFAGQGKMNLATLARNILVHEGVPVLVVVDADTLDEQTAEEARLDTKAIIRYVAGTIPVDVFFFLPEVEAIFFEAPAVLARLTGREWTAEELARGCTSPKATLQAMLSQGGPKAETPALLANIDEDMADALRQGRQFAALLRVLRSLRKPAGEDRRRRPRAARPAR